VKQYKLEMPMMTIQATPDELIVGWVITQYLNWVERTANKSREQLELVALLRSFQGRVVAPIHQHQLMTAPFSSREG
jgi:hypothetical protein